MKMHDKSKTIKKYKKRETPPIPWTQEEIDALVEN